MRLNAERRELREHVRSVGRNWQHGLGDGTGDRRGSATGGARPAVRAVARAFISLGVAGALIGVQMRVRSMIMRVRVPGLVMAPLPWGALMVAERHALPGGDCQCALERHDDSQDGGEQKSGWRLHSLAILPQEKASTNRAARWLRTGDGVVPAGHISCGVQVSSLTYSTVISMPASHAAPAVSMAASVPAVMGVHHGVPFAASD